MTVRIDSSLQEIGCAGEKVGTAVFRRLGTKGALHVKTGEK